MLDDLNFIFYFSKDTRRGDNTDIVEEDDGEDDDDDVADIVISMDVELVLGDIVAAARSEVFPLSFMSAGASSLSTTSPGIGMPRSSCRFIATGAGHFEDDAALDVSLGDSTSSVDVVKSLFTIRQDESAGNVSTCLTWQGLSKFIVVEGGVDNMVGSVAF